MSHKFRVNQDANKVTYSCVMFYSKRFNTIGVIGRDAIVVYALPKTNKGFADDSTDAII